MRRAGGWILGLVVVLAMAGGAWFALRGRFKLQTVRVALLAGPGGRQPTYDAMVRGCEWAIREAGGRAGRFKLEFNAASAGVIPDAPLWLGSSDSFLHLGDHQPLPLLVSVFDTHPHEPTGCFRISPGCERQGRAAAAWAKSKGARVALLRDKDSLRSVAISSAFETSARALGLSVDGPLDAADAPIDRLLKTDLVFYAGEEAPYGTAHQVFSTLREKGYAGMLVMGEADPEVSFLATRPRLVEGCYLVSPFAPAPPELAARMGTTPGPHVTAGYFAMKAALQALERANSVEPEALRRAATKLPSFDPTGASTRPVALYQARKGVFEFVETLK